MNALCEFRVIATDRTKDVGVRLEYTLYSSNFPFWLNSDCNVFRFLSVQYLVPLFHVS